MKIRKRTDGYPITFTLKSNGVAVDITGYTITINIVNRATRAVLVANGACTIVSAATGRAKYTPSSLDVAVSGEYDVEIKAIAPDSTPYHFPSQDYEPLRIQDSLG